LAKRAEGKNITHQQKKLNEDELRAFRTRFGVPIADDAVATAPFYCPPENSPEMKYLIERRAQLGGFVPQRIVQVEPLKVDTLPELFAEFQKGSDGRKASTTMAFVRMLAKLLRDKEIGELVVPIVPDEARTFGMEALFRQVGIYSHVGQLYEPVDMDTLALLQGSDRRADSRGRDHRGRVDFIVHRAGHGVRHARHQHDPVLHLLLDVRHAARRRSGVGRGRLADARISCSAAPRDERRSPARAAAPGRHSHLFSLRCRI
jgi:hypothetical protein